MMDTNEIIEQTRMCAACPKLCRHVCPTFLAWRSDSPTPHGRALLIYQQLKGIREIDERGVEVIYQCLECSNCLTYCLPEIDIATIVEQFRKSLVSEKRFPERLNFLRRSIEKDYNPFDEPHSKRREWVGRTPLSNGRVLYFVGCTASYREKTIARDTVSVLSDLGLNVRLMSDERCCGSPLFRTGFADDALRLAKSNVKEINNMDIDEIVVTCPGCYRVLTQDYPDHGLVIEKPVKHITQLLMEHKEGLPKSSSRITITYHDPCHLGRHSGIYEEPREIIRYVSGNDVAEMLRNRENAMCCGNGAGLRTLFKEGARAIANERIKQAVQTGAQYLVTSCPFCKNMLDSQADDKIMVLDLPEFLRRIMK